MKQSAMLEHNVTGPDNNAIDEMCSCDKVHDPRCGIDVDRRVGSNVVGCSLMLMHADIKPRAKAGVVTDRKCMMKNQQQHQMHINAWRKLIFATAYAPTDWLAATFKLCLK